MNRHSHPCILVFLCLWGGARAQSVPVPQTGLYLGAFVPDGQQAFETLTGRDLAIEMIYRDFTSADFPVDVSTAISEGGAIPHITWEPFDIPLQSILDNGQDVYLTRWATQIAGWRRPLFIRFSHEMNGNWYSWGGEANGGAATGGYGDPGKADGPERYVDAYRHIHGIFEAQGASNVTWIFGPNISSVPNEPWNGMKEYYPGDDVVDWIGLSGYNWGDAGWGAWQSLEDIYRNVYDDLTAAYDKPLMIAEFACTEEGGDKAAWITQTFASLKNDFPEIKAVTWFNLSKETDWRVNSSPASLAAFQTAVEDEYFLSTMEEVVGVRRVSKLEKVPLGSPSEEFSVLGRVLSVFERTIPSFRLVR